MGFWRRALTAARSIAAGQRPPASASAPIAPTPFEGASQGRLIGNMRGTSASISTLVSWYGATLRQRAHHLERNNPYATAAPDAFAAYAVGTGIMPSPQTTDVALKGRLVQLWQDWSEESDWDGVLDVYGQQWLSARSAFVAGDCFAVRKSVAPGDFAFLPLRIQLLEADHLALDRNETLGGDVEIRSGIEYAGGRRVAYHFLKRHPGDMLGARDAGATVRVPAADVIPIFMPRRIGQIRGYSHMSPSMVRMIMFDDYDVNEAARKRFASGSSGYLVTKGGPAASPLAAEAAANAAAAGEGDSGTGQIRMEPATISLVEHDGELKFSEPADVGGSYDPFQYRNLTAIGAGMGIPYHVLTGDLREANYSSLRQGQIDFRRRLEPFQHHAMVQGFCRRVWGWFVEAAVLAGAIDVRDFDKRRPEYLRIKWIPPKWEWVDPLKDLNAEKLAVRNGFKPRSEVVEAQGLDPIDVDRRIKADNERADADGLVFDSDARRGAGAPDPVILDDAGGKKKGAA